MSTAESTANVIVCQNCGTTSGKVMVEAPATVVYAQVVTAEIDIEADLNEKPDAPMWAPTAMRQRQYRADPVRVLLDPYVNDYGETLGVNEAHSLELDATNHHGESQVYAYCVECSDDVTEQFRAILDARFPRTVQS